MASLTADYVYVFGNRIAVMALAVALQSCLAWMLGPAGRGAYTICLLLNTILGMIFALGVDVSIKYHVASKRLSFSQGVSIMLVMGSVISALAITVGLGLITYTDLPFAHKAPYRSFCIALASIPTNLFSFIILDLLTATGNFRRFAILAFVHQLFGLIYFLLLVYVMNLGVDGALGSMFLMGLTTTLIGLGIYWFKDKVRFICPERTEIVAVIRYGLRIVVSQFSNQINFRVASILLAFFASAEDVGVFTAATGVLSMVMILPDTLISVLWPRAASTTVDHAETVARAGRITAIACSAIYLVICLFAKPLVNLLLSPAFESAVPVIWWAAGGFAVRAWCKVYSPYLDGKNHPELNSISSAVGMAVNLVLLWWLMPLLGLVGASLAMNGGFWAGSIVLLAGFLRVGRVTFWKTILPRKDDWVMVQQSLSGFVRTVRTHVGSRMAGGR